jgi:hypothetical protein
MTPAQHRQWAPAARHQMQEHTSLICARRLTSRGAVLPPRRGRAAGAVPGRAALAQGSVMGPGSSASAAAGRTWRNITSSSHG